MVHLSNNLLEVGHNFLGFVTGAIGIVQGTGYRVGLPIG
jgi:hypothetical protein